MDEIGFKRRLIRGEGGSVGEGSMKRGWVVE